MHTVERAKGIPPAGVLFIEDGKTKNVCKEGRIFGHHIDKLPFLKSIEPGTPCFVYRIPTKVCDPETQSFH